MTVHHKDLCPCGSGKRYKHCHLPLHQARRKQVVLAIAGVAVLAAGGAFAWTVMGNRAQNDATGAAGGATSAQSTTAGSTGDVGANAFGGVQPGVEGRSPTPAQQGSAVSVGGSSDNAVKPGENPTPWQYDVARDRHYDPTAGHMHWHKGPPPANPGAAANATSNPVGSVSATTGSGAPVKITGTSSVQVAPSTPLAPGEAPKPYEYDAAKDQYFDPSPGHNHWHKGKPPATTPPAAGGTTTP